MIRTLPTCGAPILAFEAQYQSLAPENPEWGGVALLPWDAEVFGFPVAEYRPGALSVLAEDRVSVRRCIGEWVEGHRVELVACRLDSEDAGRTALMPELGFRFVETSLGVTLPRLRANDLPRSNVGRRLASSPDREPLLRIARGAFRHGRYHADPRFPVALANDRYQAWLRNALDLPTTGTRVFVIGPEGAPFGFLHVEIDGDTADLRLGAADPDRNPGMAGFHLYVGVMHELAALGVARVEARVSAGNVAILNIYGALGFRFSGPETVFHWHRERSKHLSGPSQAVRNETLHGTSRAP